MNKKPVKLLYKENITYIQNKCDEVTSEDEALEYIRNKLNHIKILELFGGIHPIIGIVGLGLMLVFTVGGTLISLYMGLGASYALIVTKYYIGLPGTLGLVLLGIGVGYFFARPLLIATFEIARYLFACTSSERLYTYLVKSRRIELATITQIKRDGDRKIIEYRHIDSKNMAIDDFYVTKSDTDVNINDRVNIIYSAGVRIVL